MTKRYLEKLSNLIDELNVEADVTLPMEVKHFFNGAAFYVDGRICASWSPVGLAFKLPEDEASKLIDSGRAKPLKYFPKGHIKKGYALFENPDLSKSKQWKNYFLLATQQVDEN